MTKDLPSPELLCKLLRYEPETGKLFWRERTPDMFEDGKYSAEWSCARWNTRYALKEAFTSKDGKGYFSGRVIVRTYRAHRVIFAMHTGAWPIQHVDHINGDKSDNRIQNLRAVSQAQNTWNSKAKSNNTSGYKGVSWNKRERKWRAHIMKNGKMYRLGAFQCPKKAHEAYCRAAEKLHGEYANIGEVN